MPEPKEKRPRGRPLGWRKPEEQRSRKTENVNLKLWPWDKALAAELGGPVSVLEQALAKERKKRGLPPDAASLKN